MTATVSPRVSLATCCAMLHTAGLVLSAGADQTLYVHPRGAVTPQIGAAVRQWKPELYRFVSTTGARLTPLPCACCGVEAVAEAADYCPWCEVIRGRSVVIELGSPAEASYLEACSLGGITVPNGPRAEVGTVGDSGDTSMEVSHVRAHKESLRKQPQTVPNAETVPGDQTDAFAPTERSQEVA